MHFYGSRSGHLLAERRKLLPNTAAIQEVHTHDTNTYTQQAPAVGHWHSLPSASCSEPYGKQAFQFCSKPHQHRLRLPGWQSQPKRKGARGQRSQIPPCCWCDPSRKGLRCSAEERKVGSRELSDAAVWKLLLHQSVLWEHLDPVLTTWQQLKAVELTQTW